MKRGILLVAAVVLLFGCASRGRDASSVSPIFTPEAGCLRDGGVWHANLRICEVPKS